MDLEVSKIDFNDDLFGSSLGTSRYVLNEELLDCGTVDAGVVDKQWSIGRSDAAALRAESRDDILFGEDWRIMADVNYACCLKRSEWVGRGLCWLKHAFYIRKRSLDFDGLG